MTTEINRRAERRGIRRMVLAGAVMIGLAAGYNFAAHESERQQQQSQAEVAAMARYLDALDTIRMKAMQREAKYRAGRSAQ